ncbi:MAG: vitamin K epoxide reductase family protein [Deinococcales bacterium]
MKRLMLSSFASLFGTLIALYLLMHSLGYSELTCPISGCDKVQASQYSKILGIPVSAYGLVAFVGLLALMVYAIMQNRPMPRLVLLGSSLGMLAYVYFTYLEAFVIRAWCFWCVCSSLCMLVIWICAILPTRGSGLRQLESSQSESVAHS